MNKESKPHIHKKAKKIILVCWTVLVASIINGAIHAISIITPIELTYKASPANTTMQTFTKAECAAMSTYTTIVLIDKRGTTETPYRIRKMPDGRCWMIDNLALSTKTPISANDTNINADAGSDFIEQWNILRQSTSNGDPVQNAATRLTNGICTSHSSSLIPSGALANLTCDGATYSNDNDGYIAYADPSLSTNSYYENCIGYNGINPNSLTGCGYLYNWYTATAGSGNYDTATNTNVSSSICPAGWTLPKGNVVSTQYEIGFLNNAMATGTTTSSTVNNATTRPNWYANGPFEGSFAGSFSTNFSNTGNSGLYWLSSVSPVAGNIRHLSLSYSGIGLGNSNAFPPIGMAVRCLL